MNDLINNWISDHPFSARVISYFIWVGIILALVFWLKKLLMKKLHKNTIKYKTQKGIELLGYVLIILISISYFSGTIKDFVLAIGLLSAGITITLQELILSIA